jgi:MFS family permease
VGNKDFLKTMNSEQRPLKLPLLSTDSRIDPNDSLTGIIVSIYDLGCFAGCIINFILGDWLGRRRAMWFAMGWIIVKSEQLIGITPC